ncbi:MAG: SCO1664 family protein [Anaerolineae bacterium]|nr:SCO1664 family protein [Thermoflexus sp.]MDW8064925.1 SCO1664 family protein [Anaerolineae bacterium]
MGTVSRRFRAGMTQRIPNPLPIDTPKEIILRWLQEGEIQLLGLIPWGSNATFLVAVVYEDITGLAIYKPQRGEEPLWDFPHGTLCYREVAAYVVSEALGWGLVPPTVLRHVGPYGRGALQCYVEADPEEHYFTFRCDPALQPILMRLAVFDLITNNADRKAGHCLKDHSGRIWAIDHGICFHTEPKLRTVIWDYQGQTIPEDIVEEVRAFQQRLKSDVDLQETLAGLLHPQEIKAMDERVVALLKCPVFPLPGPWRSVPWPLI